MEVIPKILAQNCGADVVRTLTELRAKHKQADGILYGINGNTGKIESMEEAQVWDSYMVKSQVIKSAIETSCMLLRIDDVISGIKKRDPN